MTSPRPLQPANDSQVSFGNQPVTLMVQNAIVTPRPYQVPHPPIRMATTSDETFPAAGRLGLPIFVVTNQELASIRGACRVSDALSRRYSREKVQVVVSLIVGKGHGKGAPA